MRVHMDGARIANATAVLGSTVGALRSFTVDAGVDVLTFGGTKNGMLGGEAVVFLDPALAARARYLRKVVTQLPSKMRFVAAQFIALLGDDLWLRNAAPQQRDGRPALRRRRRSPVPSRSPATGEQSVPDAARRRHRAAAGSGASSGTGMSRTTRSAG